MIEHFTYSRHTAAHVPFIVDNISNNTAYIYEKLDYTNLPRAGLELGSLGSQASLLPIEPPLHVFKTLLQSINPYTKLGTTYTGLIKRSFVLHNRGLSGFGD